MNVHKYSKPKTNSAILCGFFKNNYVRCTFIVFFLQIAFVLGLGKCTALAPDENSYLEVFSNLYLGSTPHIQDFAGTSNWIFQLFLFPAFLLSKIGIEPIYAIRGSAIINSHIILALSWKYLKLIPKTFNPPVFILLGLSLSFFSFASLGLRESFIYFVLILYFVSLDLLKKNKILIGGFLLLVSLILCANLKFYLYVLLIASTILSLLILKNRVRIKVIYAVILLSLFSIVATPSSEFSRAQDLVDKGGFKFEFGEFKWPEFNSDNYLNKTKGGWGVTWTAFKECQKNDSLGFLRPLIVGVLSLDNVAAGQEDNVAAGQEDNVAAGQEDNVAAGQEDNVAATDFYASGKPRELIILGNLPFNLINFMFGPIPGFFGGSSIFGLLDSLVWLFFFLYMVLTLFGKTRFQLILDEMVIFSINFFLVFTLFSGAVEVNAGTSFRHRVVLCLPVLVIFSRLCVRKQSLNPENLPIVPNALGKEKQ
jgi:hypothetical protein